MCDLRHRSFRRGERIAPTGRVASPGCVSLRVPLQGSWLRTDETIDFVRAVAPERAYGIHDAHLNDRGLGTVNGWLAERSGHDYRWLAPGEAA